MLKSLNTTSSTTLDMHFTEFYLAQSTLICILTSIGYGYFHWIFMDTWKLLKQLSTHLVGLSSVCWGGACSNFEASFSWTIHAMRECVDQSTVGSNICKSFVGFDFYSSQILDRSYAWRFHILKELTPIPLYLQGTIWTSVRKSIT